jgi:gliding motility-associated-like protein
VPLTNASLSAFHPSNGTLSPSFQPATLSYTASVSSALTSMTVTPTAADSTATIRVNGVIVSSGKASQVISLGVGQNIINTVVTAQDTTVVKTYTLTVTRPAPPGNNLTANLQQPDDSIAVTPDNIVVHEALSPNGDGINDVLVIDGISNHPENKLQLMDQNGNLVYQVKGYNNASKVFDGHSGKTGQLLLQGTYFYKLEYTVSGQAKQKTGYIVLKY